MKDLFQKIIINKVKSELKKYDFVIGIFLHGSFARGDFGPKSDIDLFVLVSEKKYVSKTNDLLASIKTKRPIQPIIRAVSELEKTDNILLQNIFKEGKLIYWNDDIDMQADKILKIKPYTIFTFNLHNMRQTTKARFNYELYGKKDSGLLKQCKGNRLTKSCISVPFNQKKNIVKLFNQYAIKFTELDVWY